MMSHITKIAAVENATAIWEYDPTRNDNRVLGGSLDVIAAIRTLAIKVSFLIIFQCSFLYYLKNLRFKHRGNALSILIVLKFVVGFLSQSKFHYTAIYDGEQHLKCSIRPINSVKYVSFCLFNFPVALTVIHLIANRIVLGISRSSIRPYYYVTP